jgi:hypothetical protein
LRRTISRYVQAAAQFGFPVNPHLINSDRRAS